MKAQKKMEEQKQIKLDSGNHSLTFLLYYTDCTHGAIA